MDNKIVLANLEAKLEEELCKNNVMILERREIQYGMQFYIVDNELGESLTLNIYKGKGAVNYVTNNKTSELYKKLFHIIHFDVDHVAYAPQVNKPLFDNYIGTDESGKGDYFGPLVVGGFYLEKGMQQELENLEVRDCKKVSDTKVIEIYEELKREYKNNISMFSIEPLKYNEMYSQFKLQRKNLNHLLAWGHAMVIEMLVSRNINPEGIVSDQFGNSIYLQKSMYEKGNKLRLIQNTNAERDCAVAAASIIARGEFLLWIKRTSEEYGINIPKGAADHVLKIACDLSNIKGKGELKKLVKLHFKSTKTVLAYSNAK